MKKLTVLFAAVVMALSSYAACNEYGWTSGEDMYQGLAADVLAALNDGTCPGFAFSDDFVAAGEFGAADVEGNTGVAADIGTFDLTFFTAEPYAAKWGWLSHFLDSINLDAKVDDSRIAAATSSSACMRYALAAFFADGIRASWPYSADYSAKGISSYLVWQPSWGSSYCVKEVCNDYGWKNGEEMYQGLAADVLAALNDGTCPGFAFSDDFVAAGEFGAADVEGNTGVAADIGTFDLTFFTAEPYAAKWGWLSHFLDSINLDAKVDDSRIAAATSSSACMRYALAAFFADGVRSSWPYSADYSAKGISSYLVWQPLWGQSWCTGSATVNVTYNLGGAITNDYGWTQPNHMYQALAADVIAAKDGGMGFVFASDFGSGEEQRHEFGKPNTNGNEGIALDIQTFDLAFWTTEPYASKWGWLVQYLDTTSKAAGQTNTALTNSAYARYCLAAFFGDTIRPTWPASADYTNSGVSNIVMWQEYWQHAWDNPTEFPTDSSVVLNAPYKEGESFRGWYLNEQGVGDPVEVATSFHNNLTLFAIFGSYIYNMKEVWQLYDSMVVGDTLDIRTQGIVSFVSGGQYYFQDDFGGLVGYTKGHTFEVGDKINVTGKLVIYNGAPEIINLKASEVMSKGNSVFVPTVVASDLALTLAGHCFTKVYLENMKLAAAVDKNLTMVDGKDTIIFFNANIKAADYTAGRRYQVTAILAPYSGKDASLKGGRQFMGDPAWLSQIAGIPADTCHYEVFQAENEYQAGEMVDYTITSNWLISENMGNWAANKPNPAAEQCRGMVVKNGIIYITWRQTNTPEIGTLKLIRYDAATGDRLDDLFLKDYVFQEPASDTTGTRVYMDPDTYITYLAEGYEWNYDEFNSGAYVFGPNTDLEIDDAGNILVANLPTEGHVYQIWKIDENTGDGELIVYVGGTSDVTDFADRFAEHAAIRLDRFDVAGDVTKDAIIMAPSQNSNFVYEMDVVDGKWDGECYSILCANGDVAFSYSPRIDVVDDGTAFYVDGFATYPELFDAEGNLLESFKGVFDEEGTEIQPECLAKLYNEDGVSAPAGICGCREFMCGGAYFFVMGAGSYEGSFKPFGTNFIYRFKDGNRHFAEMNHAWNISANGFGATKNAQFNYEFRPIVKDGVTTELYAFVAENGLGKYTITASKNIEPETGLEVVKAKSAEGVQKALINGRLYIVKDGKAFNAVGAIVK